MSRKPLLLLLPVLAVAGGAAGYFYWFPPKPRVVGQQEVGPAVSRQAIDVPKVRFTDATAAAGLKFTHHSGAAGQKLLPETMGGGVCVLDFDMDGKPDVLFVNGCPWPGHPGPEKAPCLTLYRNAGDGTFADATDAAGLRHTLYGMGACSGDIDNDGFPDLFVTGVGACRLFRNVPADGGRRKFVDATSASGITVPGAWPGNLSANDFLESREPLAFATSATFVDYDGDAKLDLFVCRYVKWSPKYDRSIDANLVGVGRAYLQPQSFEGGQCALYRNRGDGKFEDVSQAAGVEVRDTDSTDKNAPPRNVAKSLGVVACDPDGDGWPDLVVANDTVRNFFFHNVPGPNGTRRFEEQGLAANVAYAEGRARGAMGIDWGEYRDGERGLVVANFANEPATFLKLTDPKGPRFADVAQSVGLAAPTRVPLKFGAFFVDYDGDGRLDLLVNNGHLEPEIKKNQEGQEYEQAPLLLWNTGASPRVFEPVTEAAAGPDLFKKLVGRGSAHLDYNGDGRPDLVLVGNGGPARLLRNDGGANHQWIKLELVGDGKTSNRSAIGAEVTIEAGGRKLRRAVSGAQGYLSQSELTLTVGLGAASTVDKVTVRWPGKDAKPQSWEKLAAGKAYRLVQGEAAR